MQVPTLLMANMHTHCFDIWSPGLPTHGQSPARISECRIPHDQMHPWRSCLLDSPQPSSSILSCRYTGTIDIATPACHGPATTFAPEAPHHSNTGCLAYAQLVPFDGYDAPNSCRSEYVSAGFNCSRPLGTSADAGASCLPTLLIPQPLLGQHP